MRQIFEQRINCKLFGVITTKFIRKIQDSSRGRINTYTSGQPHEYHLEKSCSGSRPVTGFDRVECDCRLEDCPRGLYALHVHIYDYIKSVSTLKFNLERDRKEITFYTKYDVNEAEYELNPVRKVLKSFGYTELDIARWLNGINFTFTFDRKLTYLKFVYPEEKLRNEFYEIGVE